MFHKIHIGILNGRDLFSPKWITAQISDSAGRLWFVPIKFSIGNWFIAKIDRSLYVFEIDSRAIRTYYATGVRTLRFLFYDISNCQPLQTEQIDYLRRFLEKNHIQKVDNRILTLLRNLKSTETAATESHDLTQLFETLEKEPLTADLSALLTFLSELDNMQISAPVEPISTFLDDELMTTKPSFLGNLFTLHEGVVDVRRQVFNRPQSGRVSWLKMGMIIMVIMSIAVFAYIGTEEGWFDLDSLDLGIGGLELAPSTSAEDPSDPNYWFKRYSPEELATLVDNGTITKDELPNEVWDLVKTVEV